MTIPNRTSVEPQLRTLPPECDQPGRPSDGTAIRMGRGFECPKDKGYVKFLTTLGYDPNWAKMLATHIVERGRLVHATAQRRTAFAKALRQLADPDLGERAFLASANIVNDAMDGATLMDGLFSDQSLFAGLEFIRALRRCANGDPSARHDVAKLARAVLPRLVIDRGPKVTLASAVHEYFLESLSVFLPAAFTWSPIEEDFTDRLTQATREEFDDPDFNPLAARRRMRAKLR